MTHRLVLMVLLFTCPFVLPSVYSSFAQTPDEQAPPPLVIESPPPAPPVDEPVVLEFSTPEQEDLLVILGQLRETVRHSPRKADDRLKLAEILYRLGDLDAAIDEGRVAIALQPGHAGAHLQLGRTLMAKQDWPTSLAELKEATRLDPALTQAHYSLGTVHYTTGNLKAAVESYKQALALQSSFPDARYRLALVLKLAHRDQESARFMEEAAMGGVPQAQYFLGNAYRSGQGIEKSVAAAVYWWSKAVAFGQQSASTALAQLRRQTLSATQPEKKRREGLEAFQAYRERLWEDFPDLIRAGDNETVGTTLLKQNRADEAIPVLLQESYALSDVAQAELARLYEWGRKPDLLPFDKNIFTCLETTAHEGFVPAKKILARIYGKGLGTTPDMQKARAQLKGVPKHDMKMVLDELSRQP